MKNNIIYVLLFALIMSSCEYELDFSGVDVGPRLFLLGTSGSSDTTVVRLRSTVPMGDSNSGSLPLDDARVIMAVNGEEIVIDRADEAVPSLPEGCFYTLHPVRPGDKVEVRASAGGLEPVVAESSVPGAFPENEVGMEAERWVVNGNYTSTRLRFSVSFRDDSESEDYYAMQVCRMKSYYTSYDDGRFEPGKNEYEHVAPISLDDQADMDLYPSQRPIWVNYSLGSGLYSDGDAHMMVFDDRSFEDGEGVMEFLVKYEEDRVTSATIMNGVTVEESGYRCSYKVMLYRLSPELYRFIKANEILGSGIAILLAAAPPSYVYTNVRGGVGVFGGISVTETGWIPNVVLQERP